MIGSLCLLLLLPLPQTPTDGRRILGEAGDRLLAGESRQALGLYDQALALARQAGDQELEFDGQHGRANALLRLSRLRQAREAMGEMERLRDSLDQEALGAHLLRVRSIYQITLGDYSRAQEQLEELQDLLASQDQELAPRDRVNLALCLLRQGSLEEARAEVGKAREDMDPTTPLSLRVHAMLLRGDVAAAEEDWEPAREAYEAATKAAWDGRLLAYWTRAVVSGCERELREGRRQALIARLPGLLEQVREYGPEAELSLHLDLAPVVQLLGLEQSRAHAERLRRLVEEPDAGGFRVVDAWYTLGLHHIGMGELAEAGTWLERALEGLPEGTSEHQVALTKAHLAVVRVILGDVPGARTLLDEARALAEGCDDRVALGLVLHNLGSLRLREQRWPEALALFEQAEETLPAPTAGMDPAVRRAWWDARIAQGEVLHRAGLHDEARQALTELLATMTGSGARYWRARCEARLAELESTVGDHAAAREHALAAVASFRALGSAEEELELLDELARAALAEGQGGRVQELLDDALRLLRRPSLATLDPYVRAQRRGLFAEWACLSQELTLWELDQAPAEARPGLLQRGLARASEWKAQALAERMGLVSDATREQAREVRALAGWAEAVRESGATGGGPRAEPWDEAPGDGVVWAGRRLDEQVARDHVLGPWLRDGAAPALDEFTASRSALVLEFVETRDRLLVYVLAHGGCELLELGPREELIGVLDRFREAVICRDPLSKFLEAGERVRRRILGPVWDHLGSQVPPSWWIVPTPALASVPWAAVPLAPDPEAARPVSFFELRFLVDQVDLGTSPSSAVLTAWDRIPAPPVEPRALLLGDPDGPPTLPYARKELLGVAQSLIRKRVAEGPEQGRLAALSVLEPERDRFLEQPFVLVMGPEATAGWLGQAGNFELWHLVAHGQAKEDPSTTGLLLAPDDQGRMLLSAAEVFRMQLGPRLVVLSACETGLGAALAGEGVRSLAWAFLCAGARGVVATQWKVDDGRTPLLMDDFYEALLGEGLHPVQALATAQRQLARATRGNREPDVTIRGSDNEEQTREEGAHPFYWAGFQYQGDPGR